MPSVAELVLLLEVVELVRPRVRQRVRGCGMVGTAVHRRGLESSSGE